MFTYEIIENGYRILKDDLVLINQTCSPNKGTKLNDKDTKNIAKFIIKKLEKGKSPIVTLEEELAITQGITEEGLEELANKLDANSRLDILNKQLNECKQSIAELTTLATVVTSK
ncbi:TPA: DUF4907 domain-containing protein [Clostridium sporogenes]